MTEIEEAQNPETTPERLTELAKSKSVEVERAVAANPGTPSRVLLSLASRFPLQFIQNPVLPLLLLEDPNFVQTIPYDGMAALVGLSAPPGWLIESAAKHNNSYIRAKAAKHPLTPPELLWALSCDSSDEALVGLSENPNVPPEILTKLASKTSFRIRMAIAKHPQIPEAALFTLRADRNAKVRSLIAMNPKITLDMLLVFAQETDRDVLCAVAQNPNTPPEILAKLSTESNLNIRTSVAQNINAPAELLARLTSDTNGDVRKASAKNPSTPTEVLLRLKQDKNREIRDAASQQLQERRRQELEPLEKPTEYQPVTFLQKRTSKR